MGPVGDFLETGVSGFTCFCWFKCELMNKQVAKFSCWKLIDTSCLGYTPQQYYLGAMISVL